MAISPSNASSAASEPSPRWAAGTLALLLAGCSAYDPPIAADSGLFSACCSGTGACVARGLIPAALLPTLGVGGCGPDLLCVPAEQLSGAAPRACRAPGELEGRCLSSCLPGVARQAASLRPQGCPAQALCVPCFHPLDATPTGACDSGADQPSEPARVLQRCKVGAGLCVPTELLSPEQLRDLPAGSECSAYPSRCVSAQTACRYERQA